MNHIIKAVQTLFILALFSVSANAQTKVVVIPMGGDNFDIQGNCPSATGSNTIGGPAALYNFCWYLSAGRKTCDTVCGDVGGTNLAYQAENEWSDACVRSASPADVSTWFFENGNPGGWTRTNGGTPYHSLGYGYSSGFYYGKCSTGATAAGAYPGEFNIISNRNIVCPCFGFVAP